MIIRRVADGPRTLRVQVGSTRWDFPQEYDVFNIEDGDTFQVLKNGNFTLLRRSELNILRAEEVFFVKRCGPAMKGDG